MKTSIHSNSKINNQLETKALWDKFSEQTSRDIGGFFTFDHYPSLLNESRIAFEKFKHKTTFVHVGIGGSALGPEMLIDALQSSEVDFRFLNNIDPDDIQRKLSKLDIKNTLFYIVSKSGSTAETIAAFHIILNILKKNNLSEKDLPEYFVFATDPKLGDLRKIANQYNITALTVPTSIGGRYSVLTSVGLFPAFFAGIEVEQLLNGALEFAHDLKKNYQNHDALKLAHTIGELAKRGIDQTVIMPYSSLLRSYSFWFVQLWAESLGKVNKGLTPIPAYGATDQHSQMQLFMEGPKDKFFIMIETLNFSTDFNLTYPLETESSKLCYGINLSELMKAEFEGTLSAMNEAHKDYARISIKEVSAYELGKLIMWAECLTVLVSCLLEVDPFNQPGVEAGKKFAKIWLKNKPTASNS